VWPKLERRADWQIALAITAALRVFYTGVAVVAAVFLHPNARLIQSNALTGNLPAPGGWHYALLGIWERFDTLWYLRIAERGYDLPAAVVFYPLYPWLIRDLSGLGGPIAAALLISTVAVFFYFWGLLRIARREVRRELRSEVSDRQPLRTVMLAAVWPASFFFFAGYTEALAIALIVWCVGWARDERWAFAAACAFAAGLTRSAGTLAIVPLAIMAWRAPRAARWPVAIAPLGTLGYWSWLQQTGRLSVAAAYRTFWNTEVARPWTTLWRAIWSLAERFDPLVAISVVSLALFFVAGVAARRKMRIEDRCFSAAVIVHLLLRLCWPPLFGAPRYLLPVYPAFVTMGEWVEKMRRARFAFLCGALFAFNLVWMWAFLSWSLVL
jgi:Mannosyltransferase (PIG-V)